MATKATPRTKDPARTRELLLSAALDGFAQSGFSGASIDSIVAKAGFTKGAFYANFDSKEALLLEVLHAFFERENKRAEMLLDLSDDIDANLRHLADLFDEYDSHTAWVLLSIELQLQAARDPVFGERFDALYRIQRAEAGQILKALFRKSGKRAPADIDAVAGALIALGQALVLQNARGRRADKRSPGYWYSYFLKMLIDVAEPLVAPKLASSREEAAGPAVELDQRFAPALRALSDGSQAGDDALSAFLWAAANLAKGSG